MYGKMLTGAKVLNTEGGQKKETKGVVDPRNLILEAEQTCKASPPIPLAMLLKVLPNHICIDAVV